MGEGSFHVHAAPALSLNSLMAEFLRAKTNAGRSARYLDTLLYSVGKFVNAHDGVPCRQVTPQMIEAWLDDQRLALRTKAGLLGDLRTLFGFALKRQYVEANPALAVEMPETSAGVVQVHTPAQVRAVLDFALRTDKDICRALAVRYFAGLRTAESERLEEKDISDTTIEVTAANAKTRARRLVTIQPNLRAWLATGGVLPSPRVTSRRMVEFNAKLKRETGIPWPHNATRHSFVSYHLAKFENAGKTALEAGHAEQILFQHYRAVVTREAAEEFFTIFPAKPTQ